MLDLRLDPLVLAFGHEQSRFGQRFVSTMGEAWRSTWHDGGDFYGMTPSSSGLRFGSVSLEPALPFHVWAAPAIGIGNVEAITRIRIVD